VTEIMTGWHHCGKCGEVFKGAKDSLCPACQKAPIPSKKKLNVNVVQASSGEARKEFNPNLTQENTGGQLVRIDTHKSTKSSASSSSRQSTERKRKKSNTLLKFVIAWLIAVGSMAALIKWKFSPQTTPAPVTPTVTVTPEDQKWQSENLDLLNRAYPKMLETTSALFEITAPESLAQYCRQRPKLASIILNDGAKSSFFKPDTIELTERNVIRPGGLPLIETIWTDDRGRKIEMVFGNEEDRWVLDWESYVKSSSMPWSVFQSADGEEEGTFRMLVRERLVEQNFSDLQMSVVFYEPSLLRGAPLGLVTPEFLVDRKSRDGRLIHAALEARKNDKPLMGSIFPQADPPNTARVCVKIRRSMKGDQKIFTLVEVLACHWMGIDHPGVELTDTP
jgi:hypothetical protein